MLAHRPRNDERGWAAQAGHNNRSGVQFKFQTALRGPPQQLSGRVLLRSIAPSKDRGRRECRVPKRTRSLVCRDSDKAHEYHYRLHRSQSGIPRANGFNGLLRDLPGERAFLPPVTPEKRRLLKKLDASVAASGPHDFAVRIRRASSQARRPRPPHPAATFVTIAQRPSHRAGRRGSGR